jgi:succinate dehydrogenase / fumarate reductase cytochrome b subunit
MDLFGIIIFIFLLIHMWQFWLPMKTGGVEIVTIEKDGQFKEVKDLYTPVVIAFREVQNVVFYVFAMIVVAFHLFQGFQSAFQTLGWGHKRFSNSLKVIGIAYAIVVPLGFAIIPLYLYFFFK